MVLFPVVSCDWVHSTDLSDGTIAHHNALDRLHNTLVGEEGNAGSDGIMKMRESKS